MGAASKHEMDLKLEVDKPAPATANDQGLYDV